MPNNDNRNQRSRQRPQNQEDQPMVHECSDLPLLCPKCKSLLAFVDRETQSEIRIKYKDLFIYCVDPLTFTTPCRSCGNMISIDRKVSVEAVA